MEKILNHAHNQAGLDSHEGGVCYAVFDPHIFSCVDDHKPGWLLLGYDMVSSRLFGRLWETCQPHRKQPEDFQKYHKTIIGASLADSFFFSMMALVLGHSYGAEGWALLAMSVGVGIFTNTVVKGNPLTLFAIDAGFLLSQLALIISILMISGLAP